MYPFLARITTNAASLPLYISSGYSQTAGTTSKQTSFAMNFTNYAHDLLGTCESYATTKNTETTFFELQKMTL